MVTQPVLAAPTEDNARKLPQYIAALAACLGALAMGTVLGWSSPVVFKIKQANSTDYNFDVSDAQGAWISSLMTLGAAAICFPIGFIMDTLGRKLTMLLLVIPFTIGWFLITFASNVGMLMAGRFITGFAGGGFCIIPPAYTSEIAQDSIRGALGSFCQLLMAGGILFSYAIGSYTSVFVLNVLCTLIPIAFGLIFLFMPESPNFLVVKGKSEAARDALIRLRGSNYDINGELSNLQDKAKEGRSTSVSFLSSITKRSALKALIICYALMFFTQMAGINAVLFNTSEIFASAGAAISPAVATIIIGLIQVIATFVSTLVVDKLGRRILLLWSALLMCSCTTALGVYFFLKEAHGDKSSIVESLSWLPLLSLSIFIIAFSIGFGPISWMMAGELCLIDIKAFVASSACTLNWVLSFTVTSTFDTLKSSMGSGQVFWLYAGIMLFGFFFILFVVPETKGKSVDEIQVLLGAKPQIEIIDDDWK